MNCGQQSNQQTNKKQEMDTQKITADYKKWLLTPEANFHVKAAVKMRGLWKAGAEKEGKFRVCVDTKGVRKQYLPDELQAKCSLIQITPIGLNNCCVQNSVWLSQQIKGCKAVIGFNITACPCGGLMSFEPHACNEIDGKLYDITKDFADENAKWFLKLDTLMTGRDYFEIFGQQYARIDEGCRCKVEWNISPTITRMTAEDWVAKVNMMERVAVVRMDECGDCDCDECDDGESLISCKPGCGCDFCRIHEEDCDCDECIHEEDCDEMPALIPIEGY